MDVFDAIFATPLVRAMPTESGNPISSRTRTPQLDRDLNRASRDVAESADVEERLLRATSPRRQERCPGRSGTVAATPSRTNRSPARTTTSCGHRRFAFSAGIAERTPNARASYVAAITIPGPTATGFPRSAGSSRWCTEAKNESTSAWMIVASSSTNTCSHPCQEIGCPPDALPPPHRPCCFSRRDRAVAEAATTMLSPIRNRSRPRRGRDGRLGRRGIRGPANSDDPEGTQIWLTTGEQLKPVERDLGGGDEVEAAAEALVEGPTQEEEGGNLDAASQIPAGTEVEGVEVDGGTALVEVSDEFLGSSLPIPRSAHRRRKRRSTRASARSPTRSRSSRTSSPRRSWRAASRPAAALDRDDFAKPQGGPPPIKKAAGKATPRNPRTPGAARRAALPARSARSTASTATAPSRPSSPSSRGAGSSGTASSARQTSSRAAEGEPALSRKSAGPSTRDRGPPREGRGAD